MACASDAAPGMAGGVAQESVVAPLAGEEREPVAAPAAADEPEPEAAPLAAGEPQPGAVPASAQAPEAGEGLSTGADDEAGADPAAAIDPEMAVEPEPCLESDNHEAKLAHDLEELTARAEKADEYLELAQRTQADFENYRKRAAREAAAAQERGMVRLARELLPAVDNLDRALAAAGTAATAQDEQPANDGSATLVSGIKLVHADVIAALARVGIEPFSPQGEPFDPQYHEAIAQQPIEGAEPGTVVEVYQRGFRLGDSVLRPARVVVAG